MEEYKFIVTAQAAEQIKEKLAKRNTPNAHVRIGVKGGGCSGFSYVFLIEDADPKEKDIVFDTNGAKVIIDHKSIIHLNGCTLDWEKNLVNQGFKFINPNVKSKCGCGHSFSVK